MLTINYKVHKYKNIQWGWKLANDATTQKRQLRRLQQTFHHMDNNVDNTHTHARTHARKHTQKANSPHQPLSTCSRHVISTATSNLHTYTSMWYHKHHHTHTLYSFCFKGLSTVDLTCHRPNGSRAVLNSHVSILWKWSKFDHSRNPNPSTDYDKTMHNWLRPEILTAVTI